MVGASFALRYKSVNYNWKYSNGSTVPALVQWLENTCGAEVIDRSTGFLVLTYICMPIMKLYMEAFDKARAKFKSVESDLKSVRMVRILFSNKPTNHIFMNAMPTVCQSFLAIFCPEDIFSLSPALTFVLVGNNVHVCGKPSWDLDKKSKLRRTQIDLIFLKHTLNFLISAFPVGKCCIKAQNKKNNIYGNFLDCRVCLCREQRALAFASR